ncbi:Histidine kinase [Spirosomataceae bacterium TFI 002]|nr:Histidine kinase [Spirosomataceae bacterium TFI 002]
MENVSLDYYVLLIGGTLAFLLLAGGILFFVLSYKRKIHEKEASHQKDLFLKNLEATENERKRVARELHDEVGSSLSMMRLMVSETASDVNRNKLKQLIDKTVDNVRRISNDLLPSGLEEFGLEYALDILLDKVHELSEIEIVTDFEELPKMNSRTVLAIYRVVQELLNNTLKYAEASKIYLTIYSENKHVIINYKDLGKGFVFEDALKVNSLGLKNIIARSEIMGGSAIFDSSLGNGMTATIKIPWRRKT